MSASSDKPILFTWHARERMTLRGASDVEVVKTIQEEDWQPAKRGKLHATKRFLFGRPSPINAIPYEYKTVDAVFSEETDEIVVLTVKVYYYDG